MTLVFLAISRTGPDPLRHELFEVAAIQRVDDGGKIVERVRHWAIRADRLAGADPDELVRTAYYERSAGWSHNASHVVAIDPSIGTTTPTTHGGVARELAKMLLGAHLVTLGLDREAEFVAEFLRSQREPAGWAGHFDVTSAAAGGVAGYSQGWVARGRAAGAPPVASAVDLTAALLPLDPFRLAAAIGANATGPAVSALVRAHLARDMFLIVTSPLSNGEPEPPSASGAHARVAVEGAVDPAAPTAAMTAQTPTVPPGVVPLAAPTSTGDPALDGVVATL